MPAMDFIYIRELRLPARIGLYKYEKAAPQLVELDIEMALPGPAVFSSHKVADTINYATVVERLKPLLVAEHYGLVEVLADNLNVDWDKPRHDVLSDREFQTLRMLGSGRTLSEIAEALQISAKTVSVYRGRVLTKMRLRNNAEVTMYVVSNGLQL